MLLEAVVKLLLAKLVAVDDGGSPTDDCRGDREVWGLRLLLLMGVGSITSVLFFFLHMGVRTDCRAELRVLAVVLLLLLNCAVDGGVP